MNPAELERSQFNSPIRRRASPRNSLSAEWAKENATNQTIGCPCFCDEADAPSPRRVNTLLFVLSHGLFGSKNDFESLRQLLLDQFPSALILVSTSNTPKTTRGVRSGGKRLAIEIVNFLLGSFALSKANEDELDEIDDEAFEKWLERSRITLRQAQRQFTGGKLDMVCIGHSLGGLYLRHTIGVLYKHEFFHYSEGPISPFAYFSISTPHLGSRRPKGSDLMGSVLRLAMSASSNFSMLQTAKDLSMRDEPPILLEMSDPKSEYYKGLKLFTLTAISTTHFDQIVPFASSAILLANPFRKPKDSMFLVAGANGFSPEHVNVMLNHADESAFIFKKTHSNDALDLFELNQHYVNDKDGHVEIHGEVYENLRQLPWRRIHIQFPTSNTLEQLLTHQTPLAKAPSTVHRKLFNVANSLDQGEQFLQMLTKIIDVDVKQRH